MFHAAHTEDGECDISSPKIEETYAQLVSERDLQWMLLSYTRSNGCSLDVTTTGKDFDALLAYMKDDAVHFVIVKVVAGNSTYGVVEKFILVTWVGKKVAPTKRSKASRHKKAVATIVKAGLAAEVHTSTPEDVKETSLLQKLYSSRSAIHSNPPSQTHPTPTSGNGNLPKLPPKRVEFDTSPSKPTPSKIKPGPVPSRPVPTNPLQQSKEREEKERKEKEEKERIERERIEKERKERAEKEKLEKERLEKERLEKERLEKERLEKERLQKEKLEKERQEKERQEKFKRDQDAAAAVAAFQPKPKPTPQHTSSPTKPATTVGGGGAVDHNHLQVPKTPEKPGELSGDLMVKEMGRLGRKMGVSPHPPRRASPPATPSLPHHAKKPPPKVLSFGMGSLQGKRPSMEDRHVALLSLPKNPKLAYFGIYDGHQGEEAADFAAENLHFEIDKYLTLVDSKYGGDKHKALIQAFITLDENFNDEASTNYWDSGTTAIVALYDTENKKVLAVNVGDSRCVLGRGGKAIGLSEDHKPWVEKEKERILAAGKTIEDNRVNGSHAFSRSIGDREMKDDLLEPHEQAICPIPEFHEAEMSKDPAEREFLILACDGLWDVMSNAEAVHWVDQKLETEENLDTVAAELAQHAIDIGSTDNVSILIVALPK